MKIKSLEKEILLIKNKFQDKEENISSLKEKQFNFEMKINNEINEKEYLKYQNEILEKQINYLAEALRKLDNNYKKVLEEKEDFLNKKFNQFLKDYLEFNNIRISDYYGNLNEVNITSKY